MKQVAKKGSLSSSQFPSGNENPRVAPASSSATLTPAGESGKNFWRSLDELRNEPAFQESLHREFPESASEFNDSLSRRNFLKIMGASLAFAGSTACRPPIESIVPYVRQPEEFIPGKPKFYASSMCLGGFAKGVLVENHEGRPTKIEGNLDHPASLGATDIFAQASILDLYDPDRSKSVLRNQKPADWNAFRENLLEILSGMKEGSRLRVLTQTVTSPTLAAQLEALTKKFPGARWHQWEPLNRDNVSAGAKLAFGKVVESRYRFEKADVVVTLDGDFFSEHPGSLRYAREFMKRRRSTGAKNMNRLYAIESSPTLAGATADHRLPVRAGDIEHFAWALFAELKEKRVEARPVDRWTNWVRALAMDLKKNSGRSVIYAGEFQSPQVHALAHLLNLTLGNIGKTIEYIAPIQARPELQIDSLRELADDLRGGKVDLLLILDGNPVYDAPADFNFAAALKNVRHTIHFGLRENETSSLCEWHLPAAHYLESWSDARAFDGTLSLIQPLIAPLYDGKTAHEILELLNASDANPTQNSAYEIVRRHWKEQQSGHDFETWWEKSLHDGVVAGTEFKPVEARTDAESILNRLARNTEPLQKENSEAAPEIIFRPDATIRDGEFANNGWLQELPKPLTQLTWDNPALVSPRTAAKYKLSSGDVIEISKTSDQSGAKSPRSVSAAVWILPGQADDSITLTLGYGRERSGRVGENRGFNFYPLRTSDALWQSDEFSIRKMGERFPLACTQEHQNMEGRDLVRVRNIGENFSAHENPERKSESLYPNFPYEGNAWGMVIDLSACIGCKACTIACQSENNIPVVGKEQVLNGREMHWIRVDRYFSGTPDSPQMFHQPVPCMHCEKAPCELVCPVAATSHSNEGLNEMTYNRCIGTRYCSNNCPYKVRRFNFLQYADQKTESFKLMRNPDVTVRTRGVMEKCTYCVQRINVARIQAKKENREIRDGEIVTACQAVCPTEAIVFGNINDPNSNVSKRKASPLNYGLLTELNTRPRTTYLERVRNPNPELETFTEAKKGNQGGNK